MHDTAPEPPPPMVGCLVCHTEGMLNLVEKQNRRFPAFLPLFGADYPELLCEHCGSAALFDWNGERWRIKYRRISRQHYAFAALCFLNAGWLGADDALDISTQVYVQRQRLKQTLSGDLAWLKPARLAPPPPLMSAEEKVFLTLKPVTYYETSKSPAGLPWFGAKDVALDSGTCYITDSKIHLLGQRRDRSHRLSEISGTDHANGIWRIHILISDIPHHYQGSGQATNLDAELIATVVEILRGSAD